MVERDVLYETKYLKKEISSGILPDSSLNHKRTKNTKKKRKRKQTDIEVSLHIIF